MPYMRNKRTGEVIEVDATGRPVGPPADPTFPLQGPKMAGEIAHTDSATAKTQEETKWIPRLNQAELNIKNIQAGTAAQAAAAQRQKQTDEANQAATKNTNAMESMRQLYRAVDRARGLTSDASTGFGNTVGMHAPWASDAKKLDAVINQQVRGNIFKSWVDNLKAATDQGTTGIGRIMQSEIPLVTGAIGTLDPNAFGAEDMGKSYDTIQNSQLRSAAILNGQDPNDQKVANRYRAQFTGDQDSANSGLAEGYKSLEAQMEGKTPAQRQAMLRAFNSDPAVQMLKRQAGFRDPPPGPARAPRKATGGNVIHYDAQGNRVQ